MLNGKNIVLGVTGSLSAWKACPLCAELKNANVNTDVIMTANAQRFIAPLTFASLTGNPVVCDQFERPTAWDVKHISLAHKAQLFLIAPCTADMLGKIANGVADDMLSTTVMATKAPVMICPAMDAATRSHPAVQANVQKLIQKGMIIVGGEDGGMADTETILQAIEKVFAD